MADFAPPPVTGPHGRRPWYELGVVEDDLMDNKLLHYLGGATQQLSDVGEVLDTGKRITTHESWFPEWIATADRVRGYADDSLARGHRTSAGKTYFRAAHYYRAALIHDHGRDHGRVVKAATDARDCFAQAVELLELPLTSTPVPYEDTTLPAWFVRSPNADALAPTMILHQGLDAWPEETWWVVQGALDRGYHMLLLHGPGQGLARRLQGLPYRHDWEKVVTPAVDVVLQQPGVDPDRIILNGLSFGGYLATRAAAFEPRIHATVVNPGLLDFYESTTANLPRPIVDLVDTDPDQIDVILGNLGPEGELFRFYSYEMPSRFGETSVGAWLKALQAYDVTPYVDRITCKFLIMEGEAEWFMRGQSQKLYDALPGPKDMIVFTAEDTAMEHCQAGAGLVAERALFDWLDENVR